MHFELIEMNHIFVPFFRLFDWNYFVNGIQL